MNDNRRLYMESYNWGGKNCYVHKNESADICLIQPIGNHDLAIFDKEMEQIKKLAPTVPFSFVAMLINDWNNELSPWKAPAVFGDEDFGAGANDTLTFITEILLKELNVNTDHICLGGYSLAGLFSLWAAYQTGIFSGIAAVSPSVWFPGWDNYMESQSIKTPDVYLSLGDKEEKTRNKTMSVVGNNIRRQHELLRFSVNRRTLEWNPGNHFTSPELRMAKGFAWLLNKK